MSSDKLIRTPVYREMSLWHFGKIKEESVEMILKVKWNREFYTIAGKQINYYFTQHWQKAQ